MSRAFFQSKKSILFIDDDRVLLELGRFSLEHAGYKFIGASNGQEGLRLAHGHYPDLIVLDYMMPDLSGREVFDELLRGGDPLRHTPIVMLTARTKNSAEERELLEMGLAAYLHKPFGYDELLNIIDNVLITTQIKERNRALEAEARVSFTSTVRALINLLFAKDNYTGEHSNMLVELAEAVALRFGLSEIEALYVKLGALLHDIGKIGIPEAILHKPARLTPEEFSAMQRHVDYGERALSGVPRMEKVHAIVKSHHEWWNGGGYPCGLKGEAIPLGARIVAVVDAYDAMTSDRPYRQQLPEDIAIERLRAAVGIQFDPLVVAKFEECLVDYKVRTDRSLDLQFLEEIHPLV